MKNKESVASMIAAISSAMEDEFVEAEKPVSVSVDQFNVSILPWRVEGSTQFDLTILLQPVIPALADYSLYATLVNVDHRTPIIEKFMSHQTAVFSGLAHASYSLSFKAVPSRSFGLVPGVKEREWDVHAETPLVARLQAGEEDSLRRE